MKIVIFVSNANADDIYALFMWSWMNRVANTLVVAYGSLGVDDKEPNQLSLQIWSFNPFKINGRLGDVEVVNLTGSELYIRQLFFSSKFEFPETSLCRCQPNVM